MLKIRDDVDYCACGINNNDIDEDDKADLDIDYNDIKKLDEDVSCEISEVEHE